MARSYDTGVGDGIKTAFLFSFAGEGYGYISLEDIVVEVDLVPTVAFEFTGPNQVTFDVAPSAGAAIRIRRVMDKETIYALFDRGNDFTKDKVNNNLLQMLYTLHEFLDGFVANDAESVQDLLMGGFLIKDLGDGVAATDAITKQQFEVGVDTSTANKDAAAASAAAALVSESAAAADAASTATDAAATAADLIATNQDTIETAAYAVSTAADAAATAADLVATNQDTIDTAADAASTAADAAATAADLVATTQDTINTAADAVSTAADLVATNQDTIDTAADAVAAATSAAEAAASAASVVTVNDMLALIGITGQADGSTAEMIGYFVTFPQAAFYGGGDFVWQAGLNKNLANGGVVIDPDTIGGFDGTHSTLSAFLTAQGSGVGLGCWVRQDTTYPTFEGFGAVGDDSQDDTASWESAIAWASSTGHKTLNMMNGQVYKITGLITINHGISIVGPGSQGTNGDGYGCHINHYSNTGLFLWDGNATTTAKGTGGQLKNVTIKKANGYSGGDAIKLLATDDGHRPGEMVFDNVLIYGEGTGEWARGVHIDGSAAVTPGTTGVRSICFKKVRVADCSTNNEFILINQGVHIKTFDLDVSQGSGAGVCGLTIKGGSLYVDMLGSEIFGNIIIEGTADKINMQGYYQAVQQNLTTCTGSFVGTTDNKVINKSQSFTVGCNKNPRFMALFQASASAVTGDDSDYTVLFPVERYDNSGEYDTASSKFTAECAGIYTFHAQILLNGIGAAHTRGDPYLLQKTAVGAERNATDKVVALFAQSVAGYYTVDMTAQFKMEYGDTVEVVINAEGGTKTVGIAGAGGTEYTFFTGALL